MSRWATLTKFTLSITEAYVAELMKNKSSGLVPKIAKYRSADIAAPYVLVCNHSDTNSKIVSSNMPLALSSASFLLPSYFEPNPGVTGFEWPPDDS